MDVEGLFIAIGHRPNTDVFRDWLEVDAKGYLVVHDETGSKIDGVFIAGDVHDHRYRQAVTAAADGCKAAIDAERWLESQGIVENAHRGVLVSRGAIPRTELSVADAVRTALDAAFDAADARAASASPSQPTAVLDAGCGRVSALKPYRARIGRFVGADIHVPAPGALPYLDEFVAVDLCAESDAFPPDTFDVILSSFTVEHFSDPSAAFRHLRGWLAARAAGSVISTVNRRHPFVRAYLATPERLRRPLQRLVKASAADAHPLVGACNDPASIERELKAAGFVDVRLTTVGHLARAWGRRRTTRALGILGDRLARRTPSRLSTIVAEAAAPSA